MFDSLLFAAPVAGRGSVRDYFDEVSYGQVTVVAVNLPSTTGWQRAPATLAYYANGQWGWGAYPQNAGRMVEDVIPLVDPLIDFSQYDNDGDLLVDSLLVIHAGTGAEFSTNTNDIWSHASSIAMMGGTPPMLDGVVLDRYVTVPEYWNPGLANPGATDMTIGVICHEIAHGLWGLPDLWDLDGSSQGIGQWGLMAAGDWNGPPMWNPFTNQWVAGGSSPDWPDPFSRVVAGFDSYWTLFGPLDGVTLSPVETTANAIVRLKSSLLRAQEYFFLENRQQIVGSYDEWLPGNGVLIWHVDEAFWSIYGGPNNNTECRTIPHCQGTCAGPGTHYLVALEQADGLDNLEWAANWGDGCDPFPGSANRDNLLIGPEDDGVLLPIPLVDCNGSGLNLAVTVASPLVYMPMPRYVNIWFDWNGDGDWADTLSCPGGFQAPEWAVRNQVQASGPGSFWLNPQFLPRMRIVKNMPYETWMRVSIAEMPAPAPQDGRGPVWGYDLGETEDY